MNCNSSKEINWNHPLFTCVISQRLSYICFSFLLFWQNFAESYIWKKRREYLNCIASWNKCFPSQVPGNMMYTLHCIQVCPLTQSLQTLCWLIWQALNATSGILHRIVSSIYSKRLHTYHCHIFIRNECTLVKTQTRDWYKMFSIYIYHYVVWFKTIKYIHVTFI